MRILCVSIDLPGHLDWGGYLKTAAVLKQREHDVLWASGEAVAKAVQGAGVPFHALSSSGWRHDLPSLEPGLDPQTRELARRARALDVWLNPDVVLAALQALETVATDFKPDLLLAEPFAAAGVLLAEKLSLPLVIVGRPALPPADGENPAAEAIGALCEAAGVSGHDWDLARGMPRSPFLHLDFFCRRWYADLPEIAAQTVFCGGSPLPAPPRAAPTERPLVLVTLGSTFANDETFFRLACESAHMAGGRALAVTGKRAPSVWASLREAPPWRTDVRAWIDYNAVFPTLAAVVHHGGVGTTHAAALHGLPQIIVPHAGDQFPQAARVSQAEIGYGIRPRDFTHESAPLILADVLWLPQFRENAEALAQELQDLGGVETAADAVEGLSG